MKRILKRAMAVVLTAVMLLTAAPLSGYVGLDIDFGWLDFSTKASALTSGSCGDNVKYKFNNSTGLLTISGTGAMYNWSSSSNAPWYSERSKVKIVVIGDSVTSIGDYAFYKCASLTSITIGNSVTSIGSWAFGQCTSLTSVTSPDSVTSFGTYSFYKCTGLTSVTIGNSVTSIGNGAFGGCTGLEEMVIPYSVTSIGTAAFADCTNLGSLTVYNRDCTFSDTATAYYTTIYGFTGSTAETYANEKGFDFVAIDDTHTHVYDDDDDTICNLCGAERLVHYTLSPANGAVVDNENGLIYGIASNSADINSYVNTVDDTMTVECDSALLGTGSVVNIVKDDVIVDSYKIVLFGDVNGDGWYDGQDAITVSCLANGMLTREQVGEAVWMAADCNHDGVIDQLDVDLLNQAGVLLSSVDQTKPTEELLETSAEYNEYIGLIDQMGSEDTTDTPTQDGNDSFFTRIIAFIESIIKILNTFFTKII